MTLWLGKEPLVLASQSKARRTLLANAGIEFESDPADIDERAIQASSGLSAPNDIAKFLAREKAISVSIRRPTRYVVGADQTLALRARIFNKPAGRAQAVDQLRALAGHCHELHAAVAVACDGKLLFEHVSMARMTVRPLRDAEIENYLEAAGDAVTTTVGAYQVEGRGVHLFEHIEGNHFTILGLPLLPLLAFLRSRHLLSI